MRDALYYRDRPSLQTLGRDGYAYLALYDIDQGELCPLTLLQKGVLDSYPVDLARFGIEPDDAAPGDSFHVLQIGTSESEVAEQSRMTAGNGLAYLARFRLDAVPDLLGVTGPRVAHEDEHGVCDFVYGEQPFEIPVEMMDYAPIDLEGAETRQWRPLPCFEQDMEAEAAHMASDAEVAAPAAQTSSAGGGDVPWKPKLARGAWFAMMRRKGALQRRKAA